MPRKWCTLRWPMPGCGAGSWASAAGSRSPPTASSAKRRGRWIADNFDAVVLSLDGPPDIQDRHRPGLRGRPDLRDRDAKRGHPVGGFLPARAAGLRDAGDRAPAARDRTVVRRDLPAEFGLLRGAAADAARRGCRACAAGPLCVCRRASTRRGAGWPAAISRRCSPPPTPSAARSLSARWAGCADRVAGRHGGRLLPAGGELAERGLDMRMGRVNVADATFVLDPLAIERVRGLNVTNKPRCRDCFCRYHCAGGCHVNHPCAAPPGVYDDLCIMTRLTTAIRLLRQLGQDAAADAWLADRPALERAGRQPDDRLLRAGDGQDRSESRAAPTRCLPTSAGCRTPTASSSSMISTAAVRAHRRRGGDLELAVPFIPAREAREAPGAASRRARGRGCRRLDETLAGWRARGLLAARDGGDG